MVQTATRLRRFGAGLREALGYPVGSPRRATAALLVAVLTYCVLVLSTFPTYSAQMLGAGLHYLDYVLVSLTQTTVRSNGWLGLALIVVYAALTGVAAVNAVAQVSVQGLSGSTDLGGTLPGLVVSGCAGCGAGVLGLFGFAGALAAMPFHGNLLRVGGLLLLLFFLGRTGDPTTCRYRPGAG
ncbi:hypothetical protein [Haloarchaeobius amylolyticus]|uniref:hypothetical protein n=1 Tax=Haloarchaeobius amylolyticus TaxID=1198296 RepID=UPI0022712EDF|nr:hypothetical protein [Haloarchaeobius amylolyticus]